jgi:hypothetical protein
LDIWLADVNNSDQGRKRIKMIKWGKGFMEKQYLGAIVEVRESARKTMRGLMPERWPGGQLVRGFPRASL